MLRLKTIKVLFEEFGMAYKHLCETEISLYLSYILSYLSYIVYILLSNCYNNIYWILFHFPIIYLVAYDWAYSDDATQMCSNGKAPGSYGTQQNIVTYGHMKVKIMKIKIWC